MDFYKNHMFCVENELFYEDDKRIGYSEHEIENEIMTNNHIATVDRLAELRETNIGLKRENLELRREVRNLREKTGRRYP